MVVLVQEFVDLQHSSLADELVVDWARRFGPAIEKFSKKKNGSLDSANYVNSAACKFLAQFSSSL